MTPKATERIILGIDPGTVVMGYGVISVTGNKLKLITAGILKMSTDDHHLDRLKEIFDTVCKLIESHHPDELSIEEPFYGKNVQSMLKLGRAQGVAMAAALSHQVPVFGYSPRLIKQSITGKGSASKEQVAAMLQRILHFEQRPKFLDATDAMGVAVCHYFQTGNAHQQSTATREAPASKSGRKKYTGWEAFVQENPKRAKK